MIAGTRQKTGRHAWMGRWLAGAVALVAVVGVAGACDGGDDPGPGETTAVVTATATSDAAEALRERNIAEAKATVEAYVAAENSTANEGFQSWRENLLPYLTGTAREVIADANDGIEAEGIRTVGTGEITGIVLNEYVAGEAGAGNEVVRLTGCVDVSAVQTLRPDGTIIERDTTAPARWKVDYAVAHQGVGGEWLIFEYVPTDTPC